LVDVVVLVDKEKRLV